MEYIAKYSPHPEGTFGTPLKGCVPFVPLFLGFLPPKVQMYILGTLYLLYPHFSPLAVSSAAAQT